MKKYILTFAKETISLILSTTISVLLCLNANVLLGNLGFLKVQIKLADEARMNNSYSESIKWYNDIIKKDTAYTLYAHLALAEIYSTELENKNYDKAFEEYKLATGNGNNIQILNSAMTFILHQVDLQQKGITRVYIDFFSDENIDFVVEVMNKIYEIEPNRFSSLPINFPIERNTARDIFSAEKHFTFAQYQWEYVTTITSDRSNLAYTNDTEKILFVDSWEELTDEFSFSTIRIYKYYKYKKVETGSYEISSIKAIQRTLNPQKQIFLTQLNFD